MGEVIGSHLSNFLRGPALFFVCSAASPSRNKSMPLVRLCAFLLPFVCEHLEYLMSVFCCCGQNTLPKATYGEKVLFKTISAQVYLKPVHHSGESRQQKPAVTGHINHNQEQRAMDTRMHACSHLPFSTLTQSRILCLENRPTHKGRVFPP